MALFIIGYMASGKTTFGAALAKRLNLPFIDLDQYIETKYGSTVSEIFARRGEAGFREIETDTLKEVAQNKDAIISCGGGTPCFNENMDIINSTGISVFLDASIETLLSRLIVLNATRPLVAGKSPEEIEKIITQQLSRRLPFYTKAQIHWDSNHLDTEKEIQDNIDEFLQKYPLQEF